MGGHSTRWTGKRLGAGAASGWLRSAFLMAALPLAGVTLGAACSGGDERLGPPSASSGTSTGTVVGPACDEGETRDCSVTVAEHNGVITCLDGTQTCVGGQWTACGGGSMRLIPAPGAEAGEDSGLPRPKSLSLPVDCIDNPCDPSCQIFGEDPGPGGVTITGTPPPYDWQVGNINTLDPALSSQGTNEPCSTAEDCQFDQYCEVGSVMGCAHHPCAQGSSLTPITSPNTGLFSDCSPCVQKVCATYPQCCNSTYPGPCEHDACMQGPALKIGCGDACVNNVCAVRRGCCAYTCTTNADCTTLFGAGSTCNVAAGTCTCVGGVCTGGGNTGFACSAGICTSTWDATCVSSVPANCAGKNCALNPWTSQCVDYAEALCGIECNRPWGGCAHDPCFTGDRLLTNCAGVGGIISQVCAVTVPSSLSYCCSSRWDEACVAMYNQLSGGACAPKGRCVANPPGRANTACPGIDLTLGVPCGGLVPVCNRGSSPVPAGSTLQVVSYPPNTGSYPSTSGNQVLTACNPPEGAGTAACSLTLAQDLDAGDCINVTGCDGLPVGSEIRVNPANTPAECLCGNNWSVYLNDPCESPACIADASVSFIKKVTMYFAIDRSSSMVCTGTGCPLTTSTCMAPQTPQANPRWIPMRDALVSFFQDPGSAGLDVALRFWPDNNPAPCGPATCNQLGAANGCAQPRLFGTLLEASGAGDPHETALVNTLNAELPCGDTPISNALDGATYWAAQHKLANPEQEVVVVLITDGIANQCNTDWLANSQIARNAFQSGGVRTYVIGFGEAQENFVTQVAQNGGGRGFRLTTGGTFQASFLSALKAVRGDVLPCDVELPVAALSDPANVDVVYTDGGGVETVLTYQPDLVSCGAGWYYDDPVTPTVARLCPSTCSTVQADPGARVEARVRNSMACADAYAQTIYSQTYHADCPAGTKVQWGFLRWDSDTPSDSNVVFSARTADAVIDLPAAIVHPLATAQAAPLDTQVCTMAGPAPACPVDLYTSLGELPDGRNDYLELIMTLNPNTAVNSVPTVNNWEITYSCPYSE